MGEGSHWSLELIIIVLFTIVCYSLGHLIGSFSAFFIDRILVGSALKYPYLVLFKLAENNINYNQVKLRYAIGILSILLNLIFILSLFIYAPYTFGVLIFLFLVLLFIFLHLFSPITLNKENESSAALQTKKLTERRAYKILNFLFGLLFKILKTYLGIYISFSDDFINKFKVVYKSIFQTDMEKDGVNVYWFTRNYITEKSPALNSLLNNWFNLYSFSRNLSTCFYIAFIYIVFLININLLFDDCYNHIFLSRFFSSHYNFITYKISIIGVLIISLVMLIRYYYLYYTYYNKFLYRTFYYLARQEYKF